VAGLKLLFLAAVCLVLLLPLWLMATGGFTPSQAFLKIPPNIIPKVFTLVNYRAIGRMPFLGRWIANSALVLVTIVVAGVVVNGAAGYVFGFASHRWVKVLFWAMMAPIFVTRMVLIISQFVIVGRLGLRGLVAVVGMSIYWPTGIFLFRNYFGSVPMSIVESARLDGASEWTIFASVVLPICKPILGAATVFLGMGALGDYVWQMLNLQRPELQTFLVGLMNSTIDVRVVTNIGYDLAVGTVLFVPYLVLFAVSSRYFIKGLTLGGAKE
jgi:ABC-type glycerol-3-phosphate transport system permease component